MKYIFLCSMYLLSSVAIANSFSEMVGEYKLDVKIGNNTFIDIMKITEAKIVINHGIKLVEFKGSFEVPGVFKSELQGTACPYGKKYNDFPSCVGFNGGFLQGSFIAKENGAEFKVNIESHDLFDVNKFNGFLKVGEQIFGEFEAIKRTQ